MRRGDWRLSTAIVIGCAVLAGALTGIYGIGSLEGNGTASASCGSSAQATQALKPLARGEVAAVVVRDRPQALPALAFADASGAARSLADFRGKTVLLNLWATWCAPCRQEMPALDRLQATLGGESFTVVGVAIDRDPAVSKRFLEEVGVPNLALHTDPSGKVFQDLKEAGKAFGMPTTLLIGAEGCELAALAGPAEWDSPDALALIGAAISASKTGVASAR